jgi:hypothetical protein
VNVRQAQILDRSRPRKSFSTSPHAATESVLLCVRMDQMLTAFLELESTIRRLKANYGAVSLSDIA